MVAGTRGNTPPIGDRGREQARWNADREFLELATAGAAQVLGPDHGVTKALAKESITMSPAPPQSPGRHAGCHRCTAPHHMRSRRPGGAAWHLGWRVREALGVAPGDAARHGKLRHCPASAVLKLDHPTLYRCGRTGIAASL